MGYKARMRPDRFCRNPDCTKGADGGPASIAFLRPQAKFCSAACRAENQRLGKRTQLRTRTVTLAGQLGYFDAADSPRGYILDWNPKGKTKILLGQVQEILQEAWISARRPGRPAKSYASAAPC